MQKGHKQTSANRTLKNLCDEKIGQQEDGRISFFSVFLLFVREIYLKILAFTCYIIWGCC